MPEQVAEVSRPIGALNASTEEAKRQRVSGSAVLLLGILGLATVLRFYALASRGLINWDEPKFELEGLQILHALQSLFGAHISLATGKPIGSAKPGHALLIALSYAVLGIHAYSAFFMNAAASVIQVALTYLIGRRLFGQRVGLIAALFLAVSEYDIIYARSALSESDGNVFLVGGALVWVSVVVGQVMLSHGRTMRRSLRGPFGSMRDVPSRLVPAGLLMGMAFTINYRLIVYVGALLAYDLGWIWHTRGRRTAVTRVVPWAIGLMAAPLAWMLVDLVTRAHGLILFRGELAPDVVGYPREIFYQLHEGKQAIIRFNPLLYVQWYVVRQSWPMLILVLTGLALTARRRSFPWLAVSAPVVLPFAVYSFAPFIVARNMVATLPFASILAAAALVSVIESLPDRPGLTPRAAGPLLVGLALLLALIGASMSWRLTSERSGFASAAHYVEFNGQGRAITTNEVLVFYLRGSSAFCNAPAMPYTLRRLAGYVQAGYHYAVLDRYRSPVTDWIRRHGVRVAHYPLLGPMSIGESPVSSENSDPPNAHAPIEYVDVFRLDHAPLPRAGGPIHLCRRYQVT